MVLSFVAGVPCRSFRPVCRWNSGCGLPPQSCKALTLDTLIESERALVLRYQDALADETMDAEGRDLLQLQNGEVEQALLSLMLLQKLVVTENGPAPLREPGLNVVSFKWGCQRPRIQSSTSRSASDRAWP